MVYFELNGQPREVHGGGPLAGRGEYGGAGRRPRPNNPKHVAAPMPGAVVAVAVAAGDDVAAGQKLATLEAMKMESVIHAPAAGKVAEVLTPAGTQVDGGDLLVRFE